MNIIHTEEKIYKLVLNKVELYMIVDEVHRQQTIFYIQSKMDVEMNRLLKKDLQEFDYLIY